MIRDFFNKNKIDESAREIIAHIVASYPPGIDSQKTDSLGRKISSKKVQIKLEKAIRNSRHQIEKTNSTLGLGVYGRSRLYKTIQTGLFDEGYCENTVQLFMEGIIQ